MLCASGAHSQHAKLMANASELLAKAPQIEQVDLLAVKLPK